MREPYPTDLTDAQWALVAPHIPPARGRGEVRIREVVNAILYITRAGCQWRMLPHDFPKWRTVHDYHTVWEFDGTWRRITDALRRRVRAERRPAADPDPATARIDSLSVKGAGQGSDVGTDGGRKSGAASVTSGSMASACGSRSWSPRRTWTTPGRPPTVRRVSADSKYHNYRLYGLIGGCKAGYELCVVSRPPGVKGWVTLPRRWVVERTFAWLGRARRHSRDYERNTRTSEAFVRTACIHHMLNRVRPGPTGSAIKYRTV